MIRRAVLLLTCLGAVALGSCTPSHNPQVATGVVASREREIELARLFDQVSSPNLEAATSAADEIAQLPREELASVAAFWGVRTNDPVVAIRIGDALGALAEETETSEPATILARNAIEWLRRAQARIDQHSDFITAAGVRLLMARAWAVQGRTDEALELLLNRLDPRPLPVELEAQYEAMIASLAARGGE